jgi:transposase
MKTLSLDIRKRILACYDEKRHTREAIANRFCVSLGMVKKLIQQRKAIGEIGTLYHRVGRKPKITDAHRSGMIAIIRKRPDATLSEMRDMLGLSCSLVAIHNALAFIGMTYKKRRSEQVSKTVKTSGRRVRSGPRNQSSGTLTALSSSTSPARRRI